MYYIIPINLMNRNIYFIVDQNNENSDEWPRFILARHLNLQFTRMETKQSYMDRREKANLKHWNHPDYASYCKLLGFNLSDAIERDWKTRGYTCLVFQVTKPN